MNVSNATIVVTGGASGLGLGLAFACHLISLGAKVWIVDIDNQALQTLQEVIPYKPSRYNCLHCDIGDESQVVENARIIEEQSGGIDVLVNNATILKDQALVSKVGRHLKKHSLGDWENTLRSNLTGTFLMTREASVSMIRGKRRGLIINISSISRR